MINVGFGNLINTSKIISIMSIDSAPAKRMMQNAKDNDKAVDATQGRRTKSLILMDGGYVVMSALQPDTLAGRYEESIAPPEKIEKAED